MEVISKFRTLFLIRKNILFFLSICLCLIIMSGSLREKTFDMLFFGLAILAFFALFQIINLRSVYKIIVSDKGITKIGFLSNEKEFIPFFSISSIDNKRDYGRHSHRAGQITNGYYYSIINLKNNKKVLITPDHFENYKDIIKAIRQNMPHDE